jgi:hypothetical protein
MGRVRLLMSAAVWAGVGLLSSVVAASAATDQAGSPPQNAATSPPPAIQIGVEERIRSESIDNAVDHDETAPDARRQWRFRTRLWASVPLGSRVAFAVGLANESKGQTEPRVPLTRDETFFEQLYLDVQATSAISARIGRQNILRGDGFILFDGTSGDGSRSVYMNAVDLTYAVKPRAKVEFILVSDPYRDVYLPVINDKKRVLTEWDERFGGVYYTDTRLKGTDLQAYYFYKDERHDYRPVTHPQYQRPRVVQTLGARVARELAPRWMLTGELATQFGAQDPGAAIRARGGYLNLRHTFAHAWKPTVLFGYTGMSGDDPTTPTIEQFEPLVSRWPKWSELYILSLGPEAGVAYWTNIGMWQAEATCVPSTRVNVRATYYHLSAFHPFPGNQAVFGAGTSRGDLVEARVDFRLRDTLKGHVLYERLVPGDFYKGTSPGYFFRVEFVYTFLKSFALGPGRAPAPAAGAGPGRVP